MRSINNGVAAYTHENLANIAFPLGGLGAGMFCLQGTGAAGSFSLRNSPNLSYEPNTVAALHIKGGVTRVLEGPVPTQKYFSAMTNNPLGRGEGMGGYQIRSAAL